MAQKPKDEPEAVADKKELEARAAKQARADYAAKALAVEKNTARLRALRLATEAQRKPTGDSAENTKPNPVSKIRRIRPR
jgi:hypothetical protein